MRFRWIAAVLIFLLAAVYISKLLGAAPAPQAKAANLADLGMMLLDRSGGVSVLAVQDGSLAEQAGIRPTDILFAVNDAPFNTAEELETLLNGDLGLPIKLALFRSGSKMEIYLLVEQ